MRGIDHATSDLTGSAGARRGSGIRPGPIAAIRRLLLRNESLRGYLLLSPTLLFVFLMLVVPVGGIVVLSLFTQS